MNEPGWSLLAAALIRYFNATAAPWLYGPNARKRGDAHTITLPMLIL